MDNLFDELIYLKGYAKEKVSAWNVENISTACRWEYFNIFRLNVHILRIIKLQVEFILSLLV